MEEKCLRAAAGKCLKAVAAAAANERKTYESEGAWQGSNMKKANSPIWHEKDNLKKTGSVKRRKSWQHGSVAALQHPSGSILHGSWRDMFGKAIISGNQQHNKAAALCWQHLYLSKEKENAQLLAPK